MASTLADNITGVAKQLGESNKENVDPCSAARAPNASRGNGVNRRPLAELYSGVSVKKSSNTGRVNSDGSENVSKLAVKTVMDKSIAHKFSEATTTKSEQNTQPRQRTARSRNRRPVFKSLRNYR